MTRWVAVECSNGRGQRSAPSGSIHRAVPLVFCHNQAQPRSKMEICSLIFISSPHHDMTYSVKRATEISAPAGRIYITVRTVPYRIVSYRMTTGMPCALLPCTTLPFMKLTLLYCKLPLPCLYILYHVRWELGTGN